MAWIDELSGITAVGLRVVALLHKHRMRNGVVVQTRDMPQRKRQIGRRFAVGRIEGAVLSGVLVGAHVHMERRLDGRNRALDLHLHAVARSANHLKPVGLRKMNHGVIIRLGRSKPFSELPHTEKVPVGGAGRIIDILQKGLESCPVAQRQNDIELQYLVCGQASQSLSLAVASRLSHMMGQHGLRVGICARGRQDHKDRQQKKTAYPSHDFFLKVGVILALLTLPHSTALDGRDFN